jgi:hypothetical protein
MKSCEKAQQQEQQQQEAHQTNQQRVLKPITNTSDPPPAVLSTNKNGLPFETQRALLYNVSRFQGHDDFAKGTCDKNPELFGERASKKRKACQDKRRQYIQLLQKYPQKFVQLCSEFNTLANTTATAINQQKDTAGQVSDVSSSNLAFSLYRDCGGYSSDLSTPPVDPDCKEEGSSDSESSEDSSASSVVVSYKKKKIVRVSTPPKKTTRSVSTPKATNRSAKMSQRKAQRQLGFGKIIFNFYLLLLVCHCTMKYSNLFYFLTLLVATNSRRTRI